MLTVLASILVIRLDYEVATVHPNEIDEVDRQSAKRRDLVMQLPRPRDMLVDRRPFLIREHMRKSRIRQKGEERLLVHKLGSKRIEIAGLLCPVSVEEGAAVFTNFIVLVEK